MDIPNPLIFRAYDIRGIADQDMPDAFIRDLGRALGTFWVRRGSQRIAVGRDCRLSSPRLHSALVSGLMETGLTILDIGVVPSPLLYFTVFHEALDGGVQITGSHNPPQDNGFKMMTGQRSLNSEEVRTLRTLIERNDFVHAPGGQVEEFDISAAYVGFMQGNIRLPQHGLKIAIDAGNGASGPIALQVLRALGVETKALLCEPDGHFPVHHPDPSLPENMELLVETVKREQLDLGIAFDGDGDRIAIVDEHGEVLFGDRLLMILARAVLAERPGAAILGEVKCSQTLYDDIAAHGGRPILWKTGHALIKAKLKEEKALLAGEMSGHVFFADRYFGFDDALYAALRLLEILAKRGCSPSALLQGVPQTFSTPEIRVDCADEVKFGVVEQVKSHFQASHDVITVDGARILFEGGWGLVRASNTQPVLVLRFEAETQAQLDAIRAEVEASVNEAKTL